MKNTSNRCVSGDEEDSVADGMYQEGGIGDGVLHLIDGDDHLLGDGELLLGNRQEVCQRADDVGKAGKETTKEVTHPQQPLDVQLGRQQQERPDGGDLLREGGIPLESTM